MNANPKRYEQTEHPGTVAAELRAAAEGLTGLCPASAQRLRERAMTLERAPPNADAWAWLESRGDAAAAEVSVFRASRALA